MKYKGLVLREFKTTKAVVYDEPKRMLVWNCEYGDPEIRYVVAVIPRRGADPVIALDNVYMHCAEIPDTTYRRVTNRELAKWLAEGNGECKLTEEVAGARCRSILNYMETMADEAVAVPVSVRKWDDEEWHEPTVDYMFGKEDEL